MRQSDVGANDFLTRIQNVVLYGKYNHITGRVTIATRPVTDTSTRHADIT